LGIEEGKVLGSEEGKMLGSEESKVLGSGEGQMHCALFKRREVSYFVFTKQRKEVEQKPHCF
jgi:hypothetical protein